MKINRTELDRFHNYGVLVTPRIVYFGSEIDIDGDENGVDYASTKKLIKNLMFLDTISHKMISMLMNTPGGNWEDGMAIYDVIMRLKSHIKIVVVGKAYSMGSIILQAADKRVLYPNSAIMIHDGSDGYAGAPKDFEAWAENSKYTRKQMYKIYYERMNEKKRTTLEKIEAMCDHDCIIRPIEAVKIGLADKVL